MATMIRVGMLPYFSDTVERLGGDSATVLKAADLDEATMAVADTFIPYTQYRKLLVEAVRATHCERFGLLMSQRLGPSSLGVVGFAMQQSASVGSAFELLARFLHLHDQHGEVHIERGNDEVRIGYSIDDLEEPGAEQAVDAAAAIGHNLLAALAGEDTAIRRLEFPYPKPADCSAYDFLRADALAFGVGQLGLFVDRSVMDMATPSADPRMASLLEDYIAQLETRSGERFSARVRELASDILGTGECSLEGVAEVFRLTPRTLQNRLQREGTSFQEIIEDLRKQLAVKYLRTSGMDLTNIALLLGYSDSSAFSRSFRRWYHESPSRWRKTQSAGPSVTLH